MDEPRLRAVDAGAQPAEEELTVEQLAYETGMSVRNIRNHQSRGLLPPPEVRARVGYYGRRHVERLRLIQEMQAEGFKLNAIERLLGEHGAAADRLVGLRRAVAAPFETESAEVLTAEELAGRFGPIDENRKSLERAQKLGLLIPLGGGRFEAPSPALLQAAGEVVERGVPLDAALGAIEKVRRNAQTSAKVFVKLFLDEVWKPFDEADRPDDTWPEITESIQRLRPLASEALLALFKQTMADEVEDAFGRVLEEQGRRSS
jgi:DNA-binding transcriptional MerR regulator